MKTSCGPWFLEDLAIVILVERHPSLPLLTGAIAALKVLAASDSQTGFFRVTFKNVVTTSSFLGESNFEAETKS